MKDNKEEMNLDLPQEIIDKINADKKKKEKHRKIMLVISAIIFICGIAALVLFLDNRQEETPQEEPRTRVKGENSIRPPVNAYPLSYNELSSNISLDSFGITCKKDGKDFEKGSLNPGDKITCSYYYNLLSGFKLNTLYYELNYGNGLELINTYVPDEAKDLVKIEGNRYKIEPKEKTDKTSLTVEYTFMVKSQASSDNLYIEIKDIVFNTIAYDYYKINDIIKIFNLISDKYYLYKTDYDYITVYDKLVDYSNEEYIGIYNCNNDECKYLYNSAGDYILFDDGGKIAYNYKTKESIDLADFNRYESIELVANDELQGLIIYNKNQSGYYSYTKGKMVVPFSKDTSIISNNKYLKIIQNDKLKLLDFNGNDYQISKEELTRYSNTDFYYVESSYDVNDLPVTFFNADGKMLFDGKIFSRFVGSQIAKGKDNNLILIENGLFKEYDIEENVIYTSKKYKTIVALNDYIIVLDDDNNLKVLDNRENILTDFGKINSNSYIHWMISGYYEYNNKKGLYIVVETPDVTVDEIIKEMPDITKEEIESYGDSKGYEYYYYPETGESGKFATLIGGYAKPVLYLYPTTDNVSVNVRFAHPELLTTTYPKFVDKWSVTANKNGDLYDKNGKYYYGLYWEELGSTKVDFKEGFYVTKDNAIDFLEEKLSTIGLNNRERNEFIMYWLPILEKNGKNLVYFELTESRDEFNKLIISPKPDSLLRVAIHVKKVNDKVSIKEQKLPTFVRHGFTAVEWGGVVH